VQRARQVDVIAAGKAAGVMLNAFVSASSVPPRRMLGVGPSRPGVLPQGAAWQDAGHPLPNAGSLAGARRALDIAAAAESGDLLVVLLSGGGSALMALPAQGITLGEKQQTARTLMEQGADIHELNTVRKHLSAIKGGQLAAASRVTMLTLALSDVVGDDLSVIASGPTVADRSTYQQALDVLARRGGASTYPAAVVERLQRGAAGAIPETPKSGDSRLARTSARVIGPQRGAIDGARLAAETLGYHVYVVDDPVTGEARDAAITHLRRVRDVSETVPRPACFISSGETTVTVRGTGKGGRNQEFALAMASSLATLGSEAAAASIGTDGIDGATDAAGAVVDLTTMERARAAGMPAFERYLDDNNSYAFFERLGDLIITGPTCTNVGDLQVILVR
jgi:hydroxypyruvate reductase